MEFGGQGNNGAAASGHREEAVRYHECLRNHAAAQGGHVLDGCGEFMPAALSLTCAACGCHRSFHRKEEDNAQHHHQLHHRLIPPPPQLLMPPPPMPHPYPPSFPYHHHSRTPSGGGTTTTESSSEDPGPPPSSAAAAQASPAQGRRKRFRTRFTAEQKERMQAFAERVGWRMQRQDDALVDTFCAQLGVRRQVFKVWMHNNKQLRIRQQLQQDQQSQQPQDQQQQ
ncbi:zinc-finger homeodomain protein 6 [Brachypodium distachyon]|uniref:ZF-HD dimerization-type domain-containing protein n=1 Tax=Brachypodium distachyon TaxID=15368 RepID=I1HFY7_BRADI|nr:zinc-finger homeodomain protein 6 [Brachypodium distachyon]KQK04654.1 hypothetical protein BRADI_2g14927v3 [Brachypodium distachyon]|eukprot:XP_003565834.1 zinc-finger homeodomain protein 6 [Brachypodium distachyon]